MGGVDDVSEEVPLRPIQSKEDASLRPVPGKDFDAPLPSGQFSLDDIVVVENVLQQERDLELDLQADATGATPIVHAGYGAAPSRRPAAGQRSWWACTEPRGWDEQEIKELGSSASACLDASNAVPAEDPPLRYPGVQQPKERSCNMPQTFGLFSDVIESVQALRNRGLTESSTDNTHSL